MKKIIFIIFLLCQFSVYGEKSDTHGLKSYLLERSNNTMFVKLELDSSLYDIYALNEEDFFSELGLIEDKLKEKIYSDYPTVLNIEYTAYFKGIKIFNNNEKTSKQVLKNRDSNKLVVISPGHGAYYNDEKNRWQYQRENHYGIVEDETTWGITKYLYDSLKKDVKVYSTRNMDRNAGVGVSGVEKWKESARLHFKSDPKIDQSIWDTSSVSDTDGFGINYYKDINSRPFFANEVGADLLVSIHTNGTDWIGCTFSKSGTEVYYSNTNSSATESRKLAIKIKNNLVTSIRNKYSPSWPEGKHVSGNHGEYRWADMPSVVVEVAYHDCKDPDNTALQSEAFRKIVANSIRLSILSYLDITPSENPSNPNPPDSEPDINDPVISLTPAPPINTVASNGTYTDSVRVSWNSISNATRYEIYRCNTTNENSCGSSIGSSNPFNDTGVTLNETYYYRIKACNSNGCSEHSSYDAGYTGESVSATNPDLVPVHPIISNTSPDINQQITFSFNVRNIGEGNSAQTTVTYHLATSENINSNDLVLGTQNTDAITVFEGQNSHSFSFYAPEEQGIFWVGVCISPVSGELSTSNNCSTGIEIDVSSLNNPSSEGGYDLVIDDDYIASDYLTVGEQIDVEVTVKNIGNEYSDQVAVRFLISRDETIDVGDTEIGATGVLDIQGGGTRTIETNIEIPNMNGIFWFGACVDANNNEKVSDNNCSISPTRIEIGNTTVTSALQSDLVIRDMQLNKNIFNNNESLIMSFKVKNIGEAPSRSVNVDGYVGTGFNKVRNKVFGTSTNDGIDVQADEHMTRAIDLSNFEAGNYFFTLDIDNDNYEVESNKANNTAEISFEIISSSNDSGGDTGGGSSGGTDNELEGFNGQVTITAGDGTKFYASEGSTITTGAYSPNVISTNHDTVANITAAPYEADSYHTDALFDFQIQGLSIAGNTAEVIIQLPFQTEGGAKLRIYNSLTGWYDFSTSTTDRIFSYQSQNGKCSNTGVWEEGLKYKVDCIKLVVKDGGFNDFGSKEDKSIYLLLAVSRHKSNPTLSNDDASGGGAVSIYWLLSLLLSMLYRRKFKESKIINNLCRT